MKLKRPRTLNRRGIYAEVLDDGPYINANMLRTASDVRALHRWLGKYLAWLDAKKEAGDE